MNICLDGEFAFGLDRIVAAWLKAGQDLSEDQVSSLIAKDQREVVYQKAIHFLSYRPRSTSEMRQNLQKRSIPLALIEETLTRLQQNGLLDDEKFARDWIENRNEFRPRSSYLLKMELRRKGLSDEIVASSMRKNVDDDSLALEAARKRIYRYRDLEWKEFQKKMGGFLSRRGFSYETIAPTLVKIWEEKQDF